MADVAAEAPPGAAVAPLAATVVEAVAAEAAIGVGAGDAVGLALVGA